jgi:hypothetical protein
MATQIDKKNAGIFCCKICDFNTCKKTDYNRHLLTIKHSSNVLASSSNNKNEKKYICECCDKKFKD